MAGDAETERRSPACAWRIDRFDLIFYNARHKRWQFFAEDPTATDVGPKAPGEGLHRYQIRSLLATFRRAVQLLLSGLPSHQQNIFQVRPPDRNPNPEINLELRTFDQWTEYKAAYLDYLISTAWHDGVLDPHRRRLQEWFADPGKPVPRAAALSFLSLLPILDEWDTWGCFISARNASRSLTEDSFPPTGAAQWTDPLYVVELDFTKKDDPENRKSTSGVFLGDPVNIEGLCLDLAEDTPIVHKSPKADFFDSRYCKLPDHIETLPYRFYAALVDPIIRAVAGGTESPRQFVIAYPVSAGGRLHFLQVALSPSDDAVGCVDTLWNRDWKAIHHQLWTPAFRTFLKEEMYRIVTSAFQSEARSRLEEEIRRGEKIGKKECGAELYERIYHLFPVSSVSANGETYGYREHSWNYHSKELFLGFKWDRGYSSSQLDQENARFRNIIVDGASILLDHWSPSPLDQLAEEHRVRHSIEQQKEFLSWLPTGLEQAQKDAEENQGRAHQLVVQWARAQGERDPVQADLDQEFPSDEQAPREPFLARYRPWSLRRYVAEAYAIENEDDTKLLDALRRIMRPSLLLLLSEYFETGPAKVVSHKPREKYFSSNDITVLRNVMQDHYTPLYGEIIRRIKTLDLRELISSTLTTFHTRLLTEIAKVSVSSVDDLLPKTATDSLADLHQKIRSESLGPLAPYEGRALHGFRSYCVEPMIVLQEFFAKLASETGYLKEGRYERKLRDLRYQKQWVPKDGYAVKRLEHLITFGMTSQLPEIDRFAKGNLCQLWGSRQEAVADLLVYTKDSTHVFTDGRFVRDTILHDQLSKDKVAASLFGQGACACLVIRMEMWRTIEHPRIVKNWADPLGDRDFSVETLLTRQESIGG